MAVYFDRGNTQLERSTFVRDQDYVVIDCIALTAIALTFSGAAPQVMRFADPIEALFCQNDLENELARTGWTLTECEPTRPSKEVGGRSAEFEPVIMNS